MASVRFSDIIKSYDSREASGDFSVWIQKLELVANLQKIEDKLQFVPLFLTGSAFAVYQQLSDTAKGNYETLKQELTTAFSSNAFLAYEQLRDRVLQEGEGVDVYLADLRRLVSLTGQKEADPILRCAFVAGLPTELSVHLKSLAGLEKLALSDIVAKARAMLATKPVMNSFGCAAAPGPQSGVGPRQCYNCHGVGHISRNCPSPRQPSNDLSRAPRRCYICRSPDHLANKCNQGSGNGRGAASASDVRPVSN